MSAWPLAVGALVNLVLSLKTNSEIGSAVLFAVSTILFWMFLAVLLKPKDVKEVNEEQIEIGLLRRVAQAVVEAYECDDLWVDGEYGAASLSEAHRLSKEWQSKYAPENQGPSAD